jgi:hypothetical protein
MPIKLNPDVTSKQRDCRLVLTFSGGQIALSFDDAIEFKIQIGHVLETGVANDRKIVSDIDTWSAQIVPNAGGFGLLLDQPSTSPSKLLLSLDEATRFSTELQTFIDKAGSRS